MGLLHFKDTAAIFRITGVICHMLCFSDIAANTSTTMVKYKNSQFVKIFIHGCQLQHNAKILTVFQKPYLFQYLSSEYQD
jgi:hypothetical protein